ncbi:MAG: GlsB/YeaQ/YmgE family stress response membrane protein [Patescibacteria group bacterium]|nr:GlsB/YeaQ/YmgE family stress response membrane protein [Patescibacteria group bacterium]
MSLLIMLFIGGLVGYIAARLLGRREGIIASILIGIVGSFIGGFVSRMLSGSDQSFLAFNWMGLFWSMIGSLILVAIMNALSHRSHRTI